MSKTEEKIARATNWFFKLSDDEKKIVFHNLLEFAIDAEWLSMRSEDDKEECLEEGMTAEQFDAPYLSSCGEPLNKI